MQNWQFIHGMVIAALCLCFLAAGCNDTEKKYYIIQSAANLSDLTVSVGSLDPVFNENDTFYTVAVDASTASISITPTAKSDTSIITVNSVSVASGSPSAAVSLTAGINNIIILVTAADGLTTKSYTVQVIRASASADLAGLVVSHGTLSPSFSPQTTFYLIDAKLFTDDSIVITPTAVDASAAIEVNTESVSSGADSSPIALAYGMTSISIVVTGIDGTTVKSYAILVFKEKTPTYIKADNAEADDRFGISVAVDGDLLVIGAAAEASNATGVNGNESDNSMAWAGAAYVYRRNNGVWEKEAYLKASNTEAGDTFGVKVAVDGDTIAVAATFEASNAVGVNGNEADNSLTGAGAVYIFRNTAGTWAQEAYIKASNPDSMDTFGEFLALDGDTLAVASIAEASDSDVIDTGQADNSADYAGAVYVFTRSGTIWSQQAYIKAPNSDAFDTFGIGLDIEGDMLAVGASGDASNATGINGDETDNSVSAAGSVFIFTRSAGIWTKQAYIKPDIIGMNDYFGISLALSENTLAVGASSEASSATGINGDASDNSCAGAGAVYIFTVNTGVWTQETYIKASNTESDDNFGRSVALDGDNLLVYAMGEQSNASGVNGDQSDNSLNRPGAIYLFQRNAGIWSQTAYIKASNTDADDDFGMTLSVSGDTYVFGAYGEDSSATGINGDQSINSASMAGAAYVY